MGTLILPRFYQARIEIAQVKQLKAECDANPEAALLPKSMRLPGDPVKLRGIPLCVEGGMPGAVRGTIPHVDGIRFGEAA